MERIDLTVWDGLRETEKTALGLLAHGVAWADHPALIAWVAQIVEDSGFDGTMAPMAGPDDRGYVTRSEGALTVLETYPETVTRGRRDLDAAIEGLARYVIAYRREGRPEGPWEERQGLLVQTVSLTDGIVRYVAQFGDARAAIVRDSPPLTLFGLPRRSASV